MKIVSWGENLPEMSNHVFWKKMSKTLQVNMSSADTFTQYVNLCPAE